MTIKTEYEALLLTDGLAEDEAQRHVVSRLDDLQRRICRYHSLPARLGRWLPGRSGSTGPRGMYLWGGVGRGKTFLMDLFFQTLDVGQKKRIHFHRMMRDVHSRLNQTGDAEDPLDIVANDLAAEVSVLCFDEFFVSDIGDAMILGRLLDGLFRRGVTLVATSNSEPRNLYRGGLQRQRFIPAIEALEKHTEVIELAGTADYRLRLLQEAGTFLVPADSASERKLGHYFAEIASGTVVDDSDINVLGRPIRARRSARGAAWFNFEAICEGPRSQEDYIELARWYPTVIISAIPQLGPERDNAARRFIALVDEFYDRKVKLVLSADVDAHLLYRGKKLAFEFERTSSRLTEMQTADYLHAPHLP